MAATNVARVRLDVSILTPAGPAITYAPDPVSFPIGVGLSGQRQTVSLTGSAYTNLSVPAGAKAVVLILGTAVSLTIKGSNSDVGIPLTPASSPLGVDVILPVASPTIGILNGSATAQTVEVIFL